MSKKEALTFVTSICRQLPVAGCNRKVDSAIE